MKTSELTGAALDWAVARCEVAAGVFTDDQYCADDRQYMDFKHGAPMLFQNGVVQAGTYNRDTGAEWVFHGPGGHYKPSTDWAQGGPIIEREGIDVMFEGPEWYAYMRYEAADGYNRTLQYDGPTPLIAAMRCYAASKLGNNVEVPDDIH